MAERPTPQAPKLPIAPIVMADFVSLAVLREKDGKLRMVYAGWDDFKVVLLGTSPMAGEDSGPFMTSGPDPPMGHLWRPPLTPGFAKPVDLAGVRTPMALGRTPLPTAHDRLLAQVTSGERSPRTTLRTIIILDPMARRLSPRQRPDGKRCAVIYSPEARRPPNLDEALRVCRH